MKTAQHNYHNEILSKGKILEDLGLFFVGIAEGLVDLQIDATATDIMAFNKAIKLMEQAADLLSPYTTEKD